jgi:DedD protein
MVQVAAVASQEKVDELQNKLREAGIKSFTQKVNTAGGGALTRIRVGPFSSKDEAEKVRAKLSKIGLSSSLATS